MRRAKEAIGAPRVRDRRRTVAPFHLRGRASRIRSHRSPHAVENLGIATPPQQRDSSRASPARRPVDTQGLAREQQAGSKWLRQHQYVAVAGPGFSPNMPRVDKADHAETEHRFCTTYRMPAENSASASGDKRGGGSIDLGHDGVGNRRRESADRQRDDDVRAHGVDVTDRVRCCDGAVVVRVIHDGRKKSILATKARSSLSG